MTTHTLKHSFQQLGLFLITCMTLVSCTAPEQNVVPTPTPIALEFSFEEPTYTVAQGNIERFIEETVRVVPVESELVGFGRSGVVQTINVESGQEVSAGDVLAELQQDEEQQALTDAQDALASAQNDLQTAIDLNNRLIESRQSELEVAREALNELLPGGAKDVLIAAQKDYDAKVREARNTAEDKETEVTNATRAIATASQELIDTQAKYSEAYWNWDWVVTYGTDPVEPFTCVGGVCQRNFLDDEGKRTYERALFDATNSLTDAEQAVDTAIKTERRTKEDAVISNESATEALNTARKVLENILAGKDTAEVRTAKAAVVAAEAELELAMRNTFKPESNAVNTAQKAVDAALEKVEAGRIVAPRDGIITAITIQPGVQVSEFVTVIEIADPSRLEFAGTLTSEQMKFLQEGQEVEIRPVDRPDVIIPAVIRRLPPPYGATGGSISDIDQSTRFQIIDTSDYTIVAGETIGRMRVVLERKENVLWLPPEAIRSFNKRTFVILRNGEFEERVNITVGIQTDTQVEVVKGLKAGDVIVGQ